MKSEADSSNSTIVEFDDSNYDYTKPPPQPVLTPERLKELEQIRQWVREREAARRPQDDAAPPAADAPPPA